MTNDLNSSPSVNTQNSVLFMALTHLTHFVLPVSPAASLDASNLIFGPIPYSPWLTFFFTTGTRGLSFLIRYSL